MAGIFALVLTILLFGNGEDNSVIADSSRPLGSNMQMQTNGQVSANATVSGLLQNSSNVSAGSSGNKVSRGPRIKINYRAKQVIVRDQNSMPEEFLPTGTNLIGKLLTAIDTREPSRIYKVLIPYGGRHKNGGSLPKNTVLQGRVRYPGKGKKVFMDFFQGVLPEGNEFPVAAQVLSTRNYSPGIVGDFHGKMGSRLAATLGLTMLSGMADVMTTKKALGQNGQETVRVESTAKNAFYHGLAKASELEAGRQFQELGNEQEYVTVEAGRDLIINLTKRINIDALQQSKQDDTTTE